MGVPFASLFPHTERERTPLLPKAWTGLVTRPALSAIGRGYRDGRLGMEYYLYHPRYGCCAVAGVHTAQGVQLGIK